MNTMNKQELVSALADGELRSSDLSQGIDLLLSDSAAVESWRTYHLVGDVLRSPDLAGGSASPAFMARLAQRLAQEPAPALALQPGRVDIVAAPRPEASSANDPVFRWKLAAGLASVAAAVALGWTVMAGSGAGSAGPQLASGTAAQPQVVLRDPRLDELLAAHRQLGESSALQSASYLRNATYDPSR